MKNNLNYAVDKLLNSDYTLVLYDGNDLITFEERGIKPLLQLYSEKKSFATFSAADKVIGKAAAYIYVLLKIKEIYANIISEGALNVFKEHGIKIEYKHCVSFIINRAGNDICPMEKTVLDITDPEDAYIAICNKLK